MEDKLFLANIAANPNDDTLRLVYADWLDGRGDRRGEFLRLAVAMRMCPETSGLQRLVELRSVVTPSWVRHVYPELADDDVREIVFRFLLGDNALFSCVRVEGEQDPSPYLFTLLAERYSMSKRFVSRNPQIEESDLDFLRELDAMFQPASATVYRDGGYRDVRTGHRLWMISINDLDWTAEDACSVEGEAYHDGLAAHVSIYRVSIKDGWWAVVDGVTILIS